MAGFFLLSMMGRGEVSAASSKKVVLLSWDFEASHKMDGWRNLANKAALRSGLWEVREEAGNHFLRGTEDAGIFGITAPLDVPLEINGKVATVEVKVRLRKPSKRQQTLRFGLTSRTHPEGRQGRAFEITRGADSGFIVRGYPAAGDANGLEWSRDGLLRPYSEGFPFLAEDDGDWVEWKMVFDPRSRTLAFYPSFSAEQPALMQKGVALDGVTLRSLWLNGPGYTPPERRNPEAPGFIDYDDLTVSCTLVEEGQP